MNLNKAMLVALGVFTKSTKMDTCKCIDCGGTAPGHSSDCSYMRELHGDHAPVEYVPKPETIKVMAQMGQYNDCTYDAIRVNGMMAICMEDGVVWVTKQQAMAFFDLEPRQL